VAFIATFIQGSVNFSADYKQKADLATSDQFAKAELSNWMGRVLRALV
jgi:hypothetical protein